MSTLAIKGHATRGNEVIGLLEMLGGNNFYGNDGNNECLYYCIRDGKIVYQHYSVLNRHVYHPFTLEEFFEKFPYKVGNKVTHKGGDLDFTISRMKWVGDKVEYFIDYDAYNGLDAYACDLQPYTEQEEGRMEETIKIDIPKGYEFAGIDDDNQQVVFEKIKLEYPKTYGECCEVLFGKTNFQDFELVLTKFSASTKVENSISPEPPYIDKINAFYTLLICRDAYWKIAGNWKPDWTIPTLKFIITTEENRLVFEEYDGSYNSILAFPTAEMRDVFYENFKDLIDKCKELL